MLPSGTALELYVSTIGEKWKDPGFWSELELGAAEIVGTGDAGFSAEISALVASGSDDEPKMGPVGVWVTLLLE